jgi:hypothetical protein
MNGPRARANSRQGANRQSWVVIGVVRVHVGGVEAVQGERYAYWDQHMGVGIAA